MRSYRTIMRAFQNPVSAVGAGARSTLRRRGGIALPCRRMIPGLQFWNVRDHSIGEIWTSSPAFNAFRGTAFLPEPCASCERREIDFGGCRCQAFALTGDAHATDPVCHLSPRHALVAELAARREEKPYSYRRMGHASAGSATP